MTKTMKPRPGCTIYQVIWYGQQSINRTVKYVLFLVIKVDDFCRLILSK